MPPLDVSPGGLIDLTIGSFDAPESLQPTLHYWDSQRLPWMHVADDLPRSPEFPPANLLPL